MRILAVSTLLLALTLFVACNDTKDNKQPTAPGPGSDALMTSPVLSAPANDTAAPVVNPAVTTPAPAPQTATAAGMNPPHGQPNHRCDIPVGAPLNSPPGKNPSATAPVQQTAPVVQPQPVNVQQPVTQTAPGMNPPHGQPNHRCDIPVGAPLNSPPAAKPQVNPNPGSTQQTLPSPAPSTTTSEPPKGY